MLVVTRKKGERIIIGDNIVVEVLDIRGGRIRLGVAAPVDVKIVRDELEPAILDNLAAESPHTFGPFRSSLAAC